ncbi:1-acyl-sn-glycerol-3-phosphate acyltransferase [Limihaloglobus sulfuriphilus]|uniref:1-acyl-sn-glycerol-3-phosphate acyltransferase n=1 Tax=Limihaloglobus sulfuriphilus TaxID=1851148 RepID=A0A1Q2MCV4_9BACT|nr:lysophospholipid acyltransferase family protein [Limihaloglobus sulfuriphilus]AQQ70137.1 1-acyl-sn-glycerol-3-phosphate acyltransferase [Limihaloglobus sulfuriphilus]
MAKQRDINGIGRFWYCIIRKLMKLLAVMYFRTDFNGSENVPSEGAYLLLCNHQSYMDPVFCAAAVKNRKLCFLARESLFRNRFFGALIRSLNAIPVRRGEADIAAMKRVIARLKDGKIVCMYPEGTRTVTGKISPIKPGFTLLCRRGGAGVVPMVIEGMFDAWPKGQKYPKRGKVHVKIGEPISYEDIKSMKEDEFNFKINLIMRNMQNELRENMGLEKIKYPES